MVNVQKHCWNLRHSAFFIDHCQVDCVGKSLSYWHAKILGLLVNTFAANEKYPVRNRNNLTTPIQMELYKK